MAQTTSPDHTTIQNLENKRYKAVLDQDFDTFQDLCHPQLVYGHTGGNRDTLGTYLAKLRAGTLRYHQIDHRVESIVVTGTTALVVGRMNADLTVNGTYKTLNNNALSVWTKDDGDWKFVAYQPTPLAT
ncbi:nuclear transport factor 2 family protein (plasmid) [Arthrobacter sp. D3-18]